MAVMIPEIPNPFQPGSLEDVMFEALKSLPDSVFPESLRPCHLISLIIL